jgi:glycosyltransferase involved in cell wall biosynthesis
VVGPGIPDPPTSGGYKRTLRLMEAMERAGADVHFFTSGTNEVNVTPAFEARGWHLHLVADDRQTRSARIEQHLHLLPARRSRRLAEALRIACAHEDAAFLQVEGGAHSNYLTAAEAIPAVLSTQNAEAALVREEIASTPWRSLARLRSQYHARRFDHADRIAGAIADAILCVSHQDAAALEKLGDNVIVAPNGVDDTLFDVDSRLPSTDDLLFVGLMRYAPNLTGINRFIAEGWPRFAAQRPKGRLLIAGVGSLELLGDQADPRIDVLGIVDDMAALLARARVILVPIWHGGGTRLKVLEGLAAGRPIVGTALGVSGIGFSPDVHGVVADDPIALADAAASLCTDDGRARQLATAGRRLARGYRWQRTTTSAETLYRAYVARWHLKAGVPAS